MKSKAVPSAIPPEAIQEADGSRLGQDSPFDSGSNVGRGAHPPLPDHPFEPWWDFPQRQECHFIMPNGLSCLRFPNEHPEKQ